MGKTVSRSETTDLQLTCSGKEYLIVLQSLSTVKYASHHANLREGLVPDSGRWLLDSQPFEDWRCSAGSATFWLHGKSK